MPLAAAGAGVGLGWVYLWENTSTEINRGRQLWSGCPSLSVCQPSKSPPSILVPSTELAPPRSCFQVQTQLGILGPPSSTLTWVRHPGLGRPHGCS